MHTPASSCRQVGRLHATAQPEGEGEGEGEGERESEREGNGEGAGEGRALPPVPGRNKAGRGSPLAERRGGQVAAGWPAVGFGVA